MEIRKLLDYPILDCPSYPKVNLWVLKHSTNLFLQLLDYKTIWTTYWSSNITNSRDQQIASVSWVQPLLELLMQFQAALGAWVRAFTEKLPDICNPILKHTLKLKYRHKISRSPFCLRLILSANLYVNCFWFQGALGNLSSSIIPLKNLQARHQQSNSEEYIEAQT